MALLFASSDRKQLPARLRTMLILARPPRSFQRDGHQAILLGGYRPMAFRPVPCGAGCFPDALGCYRQLDMLDAKLRERVDNRVRHRSQPRRYPALAAAAHA